MELIKKVVNCWRIPSIYPKCIPSATVKDPSPTKTITKPGIRNSMAIKKIPEPNQRLKARLLIATDCNRHTSQLI